MKVKVMEEKTSEFFKVIVYPVFAYLSMDIETTVLLIILMLIDSCLGALKAYRLGYKPKGSIFLWGIMSKLIFILIPVSLAMAGKTIDYDFSIVVKIVMVVLVISELYSILGNIYTIKNKEEIEKFDAVSLMIKKLQSMIKNKIYNYINKIEEKGGCKINEKKNKL